MCSLSKAKKRFEGRKMTRGKGRNEIGFAVTNSTKNPKQAEYTEKRRLTMEEVENREEGRERAGWRCA